MTKQIKSIKQISDEINKAINEFQELINYLAIPNLTLEEDLVKRVPTIETILKDLPPQNRLKQMLDHPFAQTTQLRHKFLSNYKGKYNIIKHAAQNIKNLKVQAQKIYYLAAELNLYKIKNQLQSQGAKQIKLKNHEIYTNELSRIPKYEKNTISQQYIRQLRQQQLKTILNFNPIQYLTPGQSLIHINLYDSINGEKVFQYLCYGEQTLLDVVSKFYCLIAKLENKETAHFANSYLLIEQRFYYFGNATRKKIEEILNFANTKKYFEDQEDHKNKNKKNLIYQMSSTKLKDLRVVFGRPYLYRHLQGCDHMIVFKDLRILQKNQNYDPIKKDKYPLTVFQGRMRKRKCEGCKYKFAQLVSINDPLKHGKNLYICNECHANLHQGMQNEDQMFIKYIHD